MMGLKDFFYRMFLTRDDDFDPLQILFAMIILVTLAVTWHVTVTFPDSSDSVKIEALTTLRWLTALLVLTAVPKWLVPSILTTLVKGKLPESKKVEPPQPPPTEDYDVPTEESGQG